MRYSVSVSVCPLGVYFWEGCCDPLRLYSWLNYLHCLFCSSCHHGCCWPSCADKWLCLTQDWSVLSGWLWWQYWSLTKQTLFPHIQDCTASEPQGFSSTPQGIRQRWRISGQGPSGRWRSGCTSLSASLWSQPCLASRWASLRPTWPSWSKP